MDSSKKPKNKERIVVRKVHPRPKGAPEQAGDAPARARKHKPFARLAEKARYVDLFDRMWDAALLLDVESFSIKEVNPAAERVFGANADTLVGTNIFQYIPEKQHDHVAKALRIARRRYYPRKFDADFLKVGGEALIAEASACVLKVNDSAEEGQIIQVIIRDVTRMRDAEKQAARYLDELKEANDRLGELSITDELTGLANRRFFNKELAKEHERFERYRTPYSILFVDVDYFKVFNDQNGHQAGDEALKKVAEIVKRACRNTDLPARYGGEEFVCLCPGVTWEGAAVLAERIRAEVERAQFPGEEKQPSGKLTASVGVASAPADGKASKLVIEAADQALYHCKNHGRNQVTTHFEVRCLEDSRKIKIA